MSEPLRLCPACQAATVAAASACWLCREPLPAWSERPVLETYEPEPPPAGLGAASAEPGVRRVERDLGPWAAASLAVLVVMVSALVDLASADATRALLLGASCAPVIAALGAMSWMRRPRADARVQAVGTLALAPRFAATALGSALLALVILVASMLAHVDLASI